MEQTAGIRFIPFDKFESHGKIPRYPEDVDCTVPLSELSEEEINNALIIFVSHCWLRGDKNSVGWDGKADPDNSRKDKYKLCVKGIDSILRHFTDFTKCYVWLDYGCLDQDNQPDIELKLKLKEIIGICDCLFTPIFDENPIDFDFKAMKDIFSDYNSEAWKNYVSRAWCRLEMLYAANIKFVGKSEERTKKMKAGLKFHHEGQHRTHFVYSSKEEKHNGPPRVLPPFQNSYAKKYPPSEGDVTHKDDRKIIKKLEKLLKRRNIKRVYKGETNDNKERHGKGRQEYETGDVSEGLWEHGFLVCGYNRRAEGALRHVLYPNGNGKGFCVYQYNDGGIFAGDFFKGKKQGRGVSHYASGFTFIGEWEMNHHKTRFGIYIFEDQTVFLGSRDKDNKMYGQGILYYPNGDVYFGNFEDDIITKGVLVSPSNREVYQVNQDVKILLDQHECSSIFEIDFEGKLQSILNPTICWLTSKLDVPRYREYLNYDEPISFLLSCIQRKVEG